MLGWVAFGDDYGLEFCGERAQKCDWENREWWLIGGT